MGKKVYAVDTVYGYRTDTLANWQAENPVLYHGEPVIISDGENGDWLKIGDGVTPFNDLPYKLGPQGKQGEKGADGTVSFEELTDEQKESLRGEPGKDGVGRETTDGGEIFNDYENNKAFSNFSTASGHNNIAGTRAFKIVGYNESDKTYTLDDVTGLENCVGERFSIKWFSSYIDCGVIKAVDVNKKIVTVDIDYVANNVTKYTFISFDTLAGFLFLHDKPYLGSIPYDGSSHAEGENNVSLLHGTHTEGYGNKAMGRFSHAENLQNIAYYCTHAEGKDNMALGEISHVEGIKNISYGKHCHVEGNENIGQGENSHTEGYRTKTTGINSHAEGSGGEARGSSSHKEGIGGVASGIASHVQGENCTASGTSSHAGGRDCVASALGAYAVGLGTKAQWQNQFAMGQYNNNVTKDTLLEIGNGNSDTDRKNAFEVYRNGNTVIKGTLTVGSVTITSEQLELLLTLLENKG